MQQQFAKNEQNNPRSIAKMKTTIPVIIMATALSGCDSVQYIPDYITCNTDHVDSCYDSRAQIPLPLQENKARHRPKFIPPKKENGLEERNCIERYRDSLSLCQELVGQIQDKSREVSLRSLCIESQGFPNGRASCK